MGYQVVGVLGVPRILLPKGECRYIVHTEGQRGSHVTTLGSRCILWSCMNPSGMLPAQA